MHGLLPKASKKVVDKGCRKVMESLLTIENLTVDFISDKAHDVARGTQGIVSAVKNVSFSVKRGEIVGIVGESGSGKSVTSLSILKLLPAPPARYTSGQIFFSENGNEAHDLLKKSVVELQLIRGNKIAMIFQEPMSSLNPVFTCGRQVVEAILAHKNISSQEAKQQAIDWFAKVKLPEPAKIFHRYPHQLSGGQKQRVMIAMAMSCHPSLLICDEPTTALDVTVQKTILQLIKELRQEQNIGVMFITHDLGVVAEVADKAVVMYKGEIVEQNAVTELFNLPQHPYTRALLACRPVNHRRGERLPVVSDFLQLIDTPSPIAIRSNLQNPKFNPDNYRDRNPKVQSENSLLTVKGLSVWFPTKRNLFGKALDFVKAVDDVNFELFKGETLGLVGESGCGKNTLGRALLRLVEPVSGNIIYNDIDLTARKRDELKSLRKDIQIVFQDPYSSLNPRIAIGPAIAEPMKVHDIFSESKKRKERVIELLENVDLNPEHFDRYPHEFSGGQRQRIVIARALAVNPSFLVCDESVSALDVSVQAQVLNLLNNLKKQLGLTIIFISHDLSVVHYMSDRIMVMNKGKIEETGNADDVYFNPKSDYTKKLVASIPGSSGGG
jgi:peptide/nickel transport system ATP-binding protein